MPLISDFRQSSEYDLVIDARSPREYGEDHMPGAVNLPVVDDDEYAEVGTLHRTSPIRAYQIGVAYSLRNIARHLEEHVVPMFGDRRAKLLVYCFRGGKRSRLWADTLATIGYRVDVFAGGYKAYRRAVLAELDTLPRRFDFRVLAGPTGCGKTRLLSALCVQGAQVLDLEELARHRGSVIGALPGISQPSQKWFDSQLCQALSCFSTDRPVWVEAESKRIGRIQLPDALLQTMHQCPVTELVAPMPARVALWREDYRHFVENPAVLVDQLKFLTPIVGGEEFKAWSDLAEAEQVDQLFERLMRNHYDPAYARSQKRSFGDAPRPTLELEGLDDASLATVAERLMGQG